MTFKVIFYHYMANLKGNNLLERASESIFSLRVTPFKKVLSHQGNKYRFLDTYSNIQRMSVQILIYCLSKLKTTVFYLSDFPLYRKWCQIKINAKFKCLTILFRWNQMICVDTCCEFNLRNLLSIGTMQNKK